MKTDKRIVKLIKENLLTKEKVELLDLSLASEQLRVGNLDIESRFCDQFHIVYLSYSYPPLNLFKSEIT